MHTMHSVGRLMLMAAGSGSTSRVEPTGAVLLVVVPRMNSMTHEKLTFVTSNQNQLTQYSHTPSSNCAQVPRGSFSEARAGDS